MFGINSVKEMNFKINVKIRKCVLESIFDECDQHNMDETGGKLIGFYKFNRGKLYLEIADVLAPGPNTRRSPTSLFQDGVYQEDLFRQIEMKYPKIEHLGSWHSHHVNGLSTLSQGDITTYTNTVNHSKYNVDFFYALLITKKNIIKSKNRYTLRHFLFHRGSTPMMEIPEKMIKVDTISSPLSKISQPLKTHPKTIKTINIDNKKDLLEIRALDKTIISKFYPTIKPFLAKSNQTFYWRGKLTLLDDRCYEILVLESDDKKQKPYSIKLNKRDAPLFEIANNYSMKMFESASKAIFTFEHDLNAELYKKREKLYQKRGETNQDGHCND